jgi:hypothetical protein
VDPGCRRDDNVARVGRKDFVIGTPG